MDARKIDWSHLNFYPVMNLGDDYEVYDFSSGYDPNRTLSSPFGVGKFNEVRPTMYTGSQYIEGARNVHMGIDLAAPAGSPVFCFWPGTVFLFAYNGLPQDYGYTLITRHHIEGCQVFALFGHLSKDSIETKTIGQPIQGGETIAWLGDKSENGGWNPHLHLQISLLAPEVADMPGVVSEKEREQALNQYVDPRKVLGPLY